MHSIMQRDSEEEVTQEAKSAPASAAGEGVDLARMKELTALLERAARAYYAEDAEIMSNREYDALCDELSALEKKTGVVLAGSPTVRVGYEAVDFLPKERHEKPMLSLGKTKSREELRAWLGEQEGLLSWKLDGLTVVLTYENGALSKAVTRGNGEIGEVITPNARVFCNLPLAIPFRGKLILRGEAIIRYSDFAVLSRTSEEEGEAESRYKNPRNLCSGSVRQLNSEVTAKRRVHLYAFALVEAQGEADFHNSRERQLLFLQEQGFETVPYVRVSGETILNEVERFSREVETFDLPSDGLVLTYDDIAYGESLGRTAKFPRDSIAFKWADEVQETTLLAVEWSASRTGLINPVAVFAPVELEGTTVQRASVHNVSIVRSLQLGIGDRISVYKANMIIPQIAENLTRSDTLEIPAHCPVCGEATQVRQDNDAQVLVCPNPECTAKKIKAFTLFTSRNAMNIDGLSEMTLEKLIAGGFIHNYDDIYHLDRYREQIEQMDGFGEKSFANLQAGVEASRHTELPRLIYALGIPGIGAANAKLLCRHFADDLAAMLAATQEELAQIEGIGPVLAGAFADYFAQETNRKRLEELCGELVIRKNEYPEEAELPLAGKVFVITGAVNHFANRNELKARIESLGGKATGSVTSKTSYLINNDVHSTTGKNKKAQELGVPVISEEDFLEMVREKE